MNNIAYIYVPNTMADWEPGYLIAELNTGRFFRPGRAKYAVRTVGLTGEPIVTMGGLRIAPELTVEQMDIKDAGLLILPGGETWLEAIHKPILAKAGEFLDAGIVVAAICGATMALAQEGFLDDRRHTSNDLGYLKMVCPKYRGERFYLNEPAVCDRNLVTASGAAPVDLTYQVLRSLDVFRPETLEAWYQLLLTRDPKYFYALMESMQQNEGNRV